MYGPSRHSLAEPDGWWLLSAGIWLGALRSRLTAAKTGFDMGVPFNELNRVLDLGFKTLPHGDTCYLPTNLQPAGRESVARNGDARREGSLH